MNKHLSVAIDSLIEFLVCNGSVLDGDLVADNEAGLGSAGYDEVAQVAVVGFDVTLAGCQVESLRREGVWLVQMLVVLGGRVPVL